MLFILLGTHSFPYTNSYSFYSPQHRCLLLQEAFPDFLGWSQGLLQVLGASSTKAMTLGPVLSSGSLWAVTA